MKKLQRIKDNVEVAFFWGAALSLVGIALTACVIRGVMSETLNKMSAKRKGIDEI